MATIQIRDVPEETYNGLVEEARAAGQSLQQYMRFQLIRLADTPARKRAALERIQTLRGDESFRPIPEGMASRAVEAGRRERER